jgi:hypothetical protein
MLLAVLHGHDHTALLTPGRASTKFRMRFLLLYTYGSNAQNGCDPLLALGLFTSSHRRMPGTLIQLVKPTYKL